VVLFSSTSPLHIRSVVAVLEAVYHSPGDPALDAFLHMVDLEMRQVPDGERERS
jgi:hypothetical protein